jgi:hypothetical protein
MDGSAETRQSVSHALINGRYEQCPRMILWSWRKVLQSAVRA